jgi:hypothetical protein
VSDADKETTFGRSILEWCLWNWGRDEDPPFFSFAHAQPHRWGDGAGRCGYSGVVVKVLLMPGGLSPVPTIRRACAYVVIIGVTGSRPYSHLGVFIGLGQGPPLVGRGRRHRRVGHVGDVMGS